MPARAISGTRWKLKRLANQLEHASRELMYWDERYSRLKQEAQELEAKLEEKRNRRRRRKLLTVAAEQATKPDMLNHWRRTITYPNDESA